MLSAMRAGDSRLPQNSMYSRISNGGYLRCHSRQSAAAKSQQWRLMLSEPAITNWRNCCFRDSFLSSKALPRCSDCDSCCSASSFDSVASSCYDFHLVNLGLCAFQVMSEKQNFGLLCLNGAFRFLEGGDSVLRGPSLASFSSTACSRSSRSAALLSQARSSRSRRCSRVDARVDSLASASRSRSRSSAFSARNEDIDGSERTTRTGSVGIASSSKKGSEDTAGQAR